MAQTDARPTQVDPADEERPRVQWPVFLPAAAVTLAVTVWCVLAPTNAESTLGTVVGWVSSWFGWYYIALATAVLVFVVYLALSRYGDVRLGPEHARPEYGTGAWAAMLFAAGIGTDLMFYAVYEPVTQYLTPPSGEGETVEAAREGTVWTLFHYGISGWGMYCLMGLALGYFAYRAQLPLAVRSALAPLLGRRVEGAAGHAVDTAAVLGTIFGVATSLGIGVVSLNVGLQVVFGVPMGLAAQSALIVVAVGIATLSAVSGVDKGIKVISQANVLLAIALAVFVLVTGRTSYLLNALVLNVGDYARLFPDMTLQTFAFEDTGDWLSLWTLFFWAWWVAWAAFVGLFLARISRGRTIKQFVAGTLIIPFCYIVMWVAIFGNAALDEVRGGNASFTEAVTASTGPDQGLWALLDAYPAFPFVAGLAILVGLLFYVTSADSGALVMANLSSRLPTPRHDGAPALRIFWAAATGALTLAILGVGGIYALQYATIIVGLPFAFVLVGVMWGLLRALRVEGHRADSNRQDLAGHRSRPWRHRLSHALDFPTPAQTERYLTTVALPALREVAEELCRREVDAVAEETVEDDGTRCVRLETGGEHPFRYQMWPTEAPVPAYGGRVPGGHDAYGRIEVHLTHGGLGYDVMGYTSAQLIDDVLDQYERHLEFLRLQA